MKVKIRGFVTLVVGGLLVWAFINPPIAKWFVLGWFCSAMLAFLALKEND